MHISPGGEHSKNLGFQPEIVSEMSPSLSKSGGRLQLIGNGPLREHGGDTQETECKETSESKACGRTCFTLHP